jgi:hypothetical protein
VATIPYCTKTIRKSSVRIRSPYKGAEYVLDEGWRRKLRKRKIREHEDCLGRLVDLPAIIAAANVVVTKRRQKLIQVKKTRKSKSVSPVRSSNKVRT